MNLSHEFDPIRQWAEERLLLVKGDLKTQTLKLLEEAGELAKAVIERPATVDGEEIDNTAIWDAIGDCVVVLTSIAYFSGKPIEDCINMAYQVIANRKGKMIGETWVREK